MYKKLHGMGISTRQKPSDKGKRLTKSAISKIHGMRMMGYSSYHIAKHLKVSPATVKYHLLRAPAEPIKAPVAAPFPPVKPVKTTFWSSIKGWFNS